MLAWKVRFHFMCLSIGQHMSMHHEPAEPVEVRRGHGILQCYRWLWVPLWVLGAEFRSSERWQGLLTIDPPPRPQLSSFIDEGGQCLCGVISWTITGDEKASGWKCEFLLLLALVDIQEGIARYLVWAHEDERYFKSPIQLTMSNLHCYGTWTLNQLEALPLHSLVRAFPGRQDPSQMCVTPSHCLWS